MSRRPLTKYLLAAGAAAALLLPAGVAGHAATGASRTTTDTPAAYVLPSAINVDVRAHTVTLPLFKGRTASGAAAWYVVTDASDQRYATAHGLNYAPKLANARGTKAVQHARLVGGVLTFDGTVSFNHARKVVPDRKASPHRLAAERHWRRRLQPPGGHRWGHRPRCFAGCKQHRP